MDDGRVHGLPEGPGLADFIDEVPVSEPDWVHVRSPLEEEPEPPLDVAATRAAIIDNLLQIMDPEIPVNIYDLGLIYRLDLTERGDATVEMTLTAPNCPVAGSLPRLVETGVRQVPGVRSCRVELTWDPPWTLDKASEDARMILGF